MVISAEEARDRFFAEVRSSQTADAPGVLLNRLANDGNRVAPDERFAAFIQEPFLPGFLEVSEAVLNAAGESPFGFALEPNTPVDLFFGVPTLDDPRAFTVAQSLETQIFVPFFGLFFSFDELRDTYLGAATFGDIYDATRQLLDDADAGIAAGLPERIDNFGVLEFTFESVEVFDVGPFGEVQFSPEQSVSEIFNSGYLEIGPQYAFDQDTAIFNVKSDQVRPDLDPFLLNKGELGFVVVGDGVVENREGSIGLIDIESGFVINDGFIEEAIVRNGGELIGFGEFGFVDVNGGVWNPGASTGSATAETVLVRNGGVLAVEMEVDAATGAVSVDTYNLDEVTFDAFSFINLSGMDGAPEELPDFLNVSGGVTGAENLTAIPNADGVKLTVNADGSTTLEEVPLVTIAGRLNHLDRKSETATITLNLDYDPDDANTVPFFAADALRVSNSSAVGRDRFALDGEYRDLVGGFITFGRFDNDVLDLFDELFLGDGIKGVEAEITGGSEVELTVTGSGLFRDRPSDMIVVDGTFVADYIVTNNLLGDADFIA